MKLSKEKYLGLTMLFFGIYLVSILSLSNSFVINALGGYLDLFVTFLSLTSWAVAVLALATSYHYLKEEKQKRR